MTEYKMPDDTELELFRTIAAAQDKYTYFMLAATGAALGFALTQTRDAAWVLDLIPLAMAAACWVASFYCGSRNILLRSATLFANINLLQVNRGARGIALPNPAERGPQMQGIAKAMHDNASLAAKHATWQFRLFVAGAALYIVWHALEMYQRG